MMKRTISLLLAAVLAVGMTTTVMADPPVGFDTSSPANAMTMTTAGTQALPALKAGDTVTLWIPPSMFAVGAEAAAPTAAEARAYIRQAVPGGGLAGVFDSLGVSGDAFPLVLTLKVKQGAPAGAFSGTVVLEGTGAGGAVVSSLSTAVSGTVSEPPALTPDPVEDEGGSLPVVEQETPQPTLPESNSPAGTANTGASQSGAGETDNSTNTSNSSTVTSTPESSSSSTSSSSASSTSSSSTSSSSSSSTSSAGGGYSPGSSSQSSGVNSNSSSSAAENNNSSSGSSSESTSSQENGTDGVSDDTLAAPPTAASTDAIDGFVSGKTLIGHTTYTVDPGQAFFVGITGDMFTYTYGGALIGQSYQSGTHPQYPGDAALYAAGITAELGGVDGFRFEANVEDGKVKITPTSLARGGADYSITVRLKSHRISGDSGEGALAVAVNSVADSMVNGAAVIDTAPVYRQAAAGREYYTWDIDHTQFILSGAGADYANQLTGDVLNHMSVVYSNAAMADLFDVTFTPGNAGYAAVTLTVKGDLAGTHTVSGTMQLAMGSNRSQAVAISGQVGSDVGGPTTTVGSSSASGVTVSPMSVANPVVSMTANAAVLTNPTGSTAPTAADTFSAGDLYYTWEIDANQFQYNIPGSVANVDIDLTEWNKMTLVYGNASYASYFRPVFTPGDIANKAKITLYVRNDATTLSDITLNSTLKLRFTHGATTTESAPVSLRGKIVPANTEAPGSGSKIDGFNTSTSIYSMIMTHNGGDLDANPSGLELRPDDELRVYLTGGLFSWSGAEPGFNYKVTEAQLRSGKVTVRKSVSKGSDTIDTLEFDTEKGKGTYIRVQFVEHFVSTKEKDVVLKVYLRQNGKQNNDFMVEIDGTMANEELEVYGGDDYVNSSDNVYLKAMEYVRGIEIDMGYGVYLTTNLYTNQKYYGKALMTIDREDEKILNDHPEIDTVITLKTVNLRTGNTKAVTMDFDGYYVYDASGNYLGRSSEKLAFSDKYYLATKRIKFGTNSVDIIEVESGSSGSSGSGSGTGSSGTGSSGNSGGTGGATTGATAASNSNSNPYTGRM